MALRPPTQLGEGLPEAEGARGHQAGWGPSWELSFLVWSTAGFLLKQTFFVTFSLCVPSNILLHFPTQKKSLKKVKGDKDNPMAECSVRLSQRHPSVCRWHSLRGTGAQVNLALPAHYKHPHHLPAAHWGCSDLQTEMQCPRTWGKLTSLRVTSGA